MKPFLCPKCSQQVHLIEHYIAHLDHGDVAIREDGFLVPLGGIPQDDKKWIGDPIRIVLVCINRECGHQWTTKRRVDWFAEEAS